MIFNSHFIFILLYKKLIFKGNVNRSLFILNKLVYILKYKYNILNIYILLELSIFNILFPIRTIKINFNNKIVGISLEKSINNALNSILNIIKINYKKPFYLKLTQEILNLYNKQGQLYNFKLNKLKSMLK